MSAHVIVGDCRSVARELEPRSFDLIIADPPYGVTSLKWDRWPHGWPDSMRKLLKPSGSMWVFGSLRSFVENAVELNPWHLAQEIVWEKHNGTNFHNDRFRRVHELVAQFYPPRAKWRDIYKEPQFTNDATARTIRKKARPPQWTGATGDTVYRSEDGGPRLMRSVIYVRSEHGRAVHPTQKPEAILEPIVAYSCPPGGRILDPFAGSGAVGRVAKRMGREATLVEINPEYAEIARERIAGDAPLLHAAAE